MSCAAASLVVRMKVLLEKGREVHSGTGWTAEAGELRLWLLHGRACRNVSEAWSSLWLLVRHVVITIQESGVWGLRYSVLWLLSSIYLSVANVGSAPRPWFEHAY